jgi:hypothetical protein
MNGQIFEMAPIIGVIIVCITSLVLLNSSNWRWSISALTLQYVGVFFLIISEWFLPMAVTVVMAGWISGFVLFTAISGLSHDANDDIDDTNTIFQSFETSHNNPTSANLFRLIAAGVVGLAVVSLLPEVIDWIPGIEIEQSLGALILIGLGLLHLGWTAHPFRVVLGLLTVLSGFEIFYAAVEISALVAGLLAGVTLGLSLVGAYLIVAPTLESTS